jgi:hypothetical protein
MIHFSPNERRNTPTTKRKSRVLRFFIAFVYLLVCATSCIISCIAPTRLAAQTPQMLRVFQPNAGERLTPGGEYLIVWTGVLPQDTVQISYSIDGGKNWRLITQSATGLAYRWSPIPFPASDSCLLYITTKPSDNSAAAQNNAASIRFGVPRPSPRWQNRWSGFAFDGSKILSTASLPSDDSARQPYQTRVFDAASGNLLFELPQYLADTSLRFAPSARAARNVQDQWRPDNTRLVNILSDTTFGIFDANSGNLLRTVRIPREGFRTALQSVGWSPDGQEIIARVLYHLNGFSNAPGSKATDVFLRFSVSDLSDRATVAQSSTIEFDRWGSSYLGLMHNRRQWLAVQRGANSPREVTEILLFTPGVDSARRFIAPSGYYWQPETMIVAPNDSLIALTVTSATGNAGAPQQLVVVNLINGAQRFRPNSQPVSWNPDSRLLLVLDNGSIQPVALDIMTFSPLGVLPNLYAPPFRRDLLSGAIVADVASGAPQVRWLPDARRIVGYEIPRSLPLAQTLNDFTTATAQAFGVWDSRSLCQNERFAVPRLPGAAAPPRYTLASAGELIAAQNERRYIMTNRSSDTALVLLIAPTFSLPCQSAFSNGIWSIRLPNFIVAPERVEFTRLICETTATARIPVRNLTNAALVLETRLQSLTSLEPPRDFSIVRAPERLLQGNRTDTVVVQYAPRGFGASAAQIVLTGIRGETLGRIVLEARRDSLAIDPPAPTVNFGLIPARTILTTTVTIRNAGDTPLVWSTAATRSALGNIFISSVSPNPTQVGDSARVIFRLQPVENLGTFRDSLPIYFCGENIPKAFVQARVLPEFQQIDAPTLIDGGQLVCERTAERTLRIQNTGGRPLTITALGLGDENFSILNTPSLPLTLQPLDSIVLRLRLSAQENGLKATDLLISSNDPFRPVVATRLQVRRDAPRFQWNPPLLRFERIEIGASAERSIQFQNLSLSPLLWTGLPRALSPDFTIVSVSPNPTPSGGVSTITVRFNGAPASGLVETRATFDLGDLCNTMTQINLEAIVIQTAPKVIAPAVLAFDTLFCETEKTLRLQILNAGRQTLRIDSLYVESAVGAGRGSATDFFADVRSISGGAPPNFPIIVEGVDSPSQRPIELDVIFRPRGSGLREHLLVIHSNDLITSPNGVARLQLRGVSQRASFSLQPPVLRFAVPADFTPVRDTLFITNTGTQELEWLGFPRILDSLFTIERIVPPVTPPMGGVSRAIVRFAGIRQSENIARNIALSHPLCNIAQSVRFVAGTAPRGSLVVAAQAETRALCEQERIFSLLLENIGSAPVRLSGAPRILEDSLNEFRVLSAPTLVNALRRDSVVLVFQPRLAGERRARLRIESDDAERPVAEALIVGVKDSTALVFAPPTLDFGVFSLETGASALRETTLENRGTVPVSVPTPLEAGAATLEKLEPNPIPPGGSARARFRVTPSASDFIGGVWNQNFSLLDSCLRAATLWLSARRIAGIISLPDSLALAPLQETDVPVWFRRRAGIRLGSDAHFRLRVANASLLQLLSPNTPAGGALTNVVENGARVVQFRFPVPSAVEDEPIARLRLRGLLGDDSATTITIDSAFVGEVAAQGSASAFRTLGLNYAGGARLYFTPIITLVAPNPASSRIAATLLLQEPSRVTFRLVNTLGQAVELARQNLDAGLREVELSLGAEIPTGSYALEAVSQSLRRIGAPPERATKQIIILR